MAEHAVGSRISLISRSEIRYEGFLHFINAKENTVGLKNVRMHGTEGRKNGVNEIPAGNQLYEYIVFRGADIKDLTVFEDQITDPAVISATPAKHDSGNNNNNGGNKGQSGNPWHQNRDHGGRGRGGSSNNQGQTLAQPASYNNERGRGRGGYNNSNNNDNGRQGGPVAPQPRHAQQSQQQPSSHGDRGRGRGQGFNNDSHRGGGRGGQDFHRGRGGNGGQGHHDNRRDAAPAHHQNPRPQSDQPPRQRHEHTGREFAPVSGGAKEFKDDFDFAKARTDFHQAGEGREVKKAYDKTSSFFDNLSNDVSDRQQPPRGEKQAMRDQQKKTDGETFGNDFVGQHHVSRYRGGGGGGGAGRGRGRGRFGGRGN